MTDNTKKTCYWCGGNKKGRDGEGDCDNCGGKGYVGLENVNHSDLWNKLTYEERSRLMPYQIQSHILHLEQAKVVAIRAHTRHIKELDDWIVNLKSDLRKELPCGKDIGSVPAAVTSNLESGKLYAGNVEKEK